MEEPAAACGEEVSEPETVDPAGLARDDLLGTGLYTSLGHMLILGGNF